MNALFEEFSASDASDWKERLSKDLKGISFDELSLVDRNGITVQPFYTAEDSSEITGAVFAHPDWIICEAIKVNDAKSANLKALNALQNGASGLCFELHAPTDLALLLQDIELQYIYTQFRVSGETAAFLDQWNTYLEGKNLSATNLNYAINIDFVGRILTDGTIDEAAAKADFLSLFADTKTIVVEAGAYQNAGANSAYQLAGCIAQTNEYLHWLDESGKLAELQNVHISSTSGTDFFEEIAKLRSLNILLENLFASYQTKPAIHLHVETSNTYRSAFDSYSNLLRDTIAGMAAVMGGCQSLLIHRFDESKNEASEFSSRMSRNQQLILKEESYLHQIADASAGSFYIEKLTEQIASKAWADFQKIEKEGGLIASFEMVKTNIELQAAQWIQEYKDGKRVLIGVNKYVNAKDEPIKREQKTQSNTGLQIINLTEEIL